MLRDRTGFHIPFVPCSAAERNGHIYGLYEGVKVELNNTTYQLGNQNLFHRGGGRGDAHIITIWKNNECFYTIGGLIEAYKLNAYYDSVDDIIYIIYESEKETNVEGGFYVTNYIGITTIEQPCGNTVCNDFKYIVPLDKK